MTNRAKQGKASGFNWSVTDIRDAVHTRCSTERTKSEAVVYDGFRVFLALEGCPACIPCGQDYFSPGY